MVKKILIVDVNVTSSISGAVQPLSPMIGGRSVSTDSLNSEVSSNQTIFYANSFILSAIIVVIPKDFIRAFSDTGILSDRSSIGYSKRLTDSINSIIDNRVFALSKAFSNLVNISDTFNKVIVFIRKPEDTLTLDDRLSILANKVLTDSINSINDNRVFALSKVVSNLVNTSGDSKIINFTKNPFETVNVLEELAVDFNKSFSDNNISLGDSKIINFTKNPFETVNVLEELAVDFNKPLSDVSVIQDLPALAVSKPFADLFTVDDLDTIDFTKGNFETITTSDINDLVFTKALIEVLQPLDFPAINNEKIFSDSITIADFDAIDFTKLNADSVSTESFTVLNTTKSIFDLPLIEDETIFDFEKNVFDSTTTVDSIPRIDFIKILADTAIVEDLTNIFDGSTYTIDKTVVDFVNSSENFSRIVDFNRAFQDVQSINELLSINFDKILESTATNNDNLALNNSLFKTDSIIGIEDIFNRVVGYSRSFTDEQQGQTDSHIFDFDKVLDDITSINDDDILSVTKILSSELSNISEISIIDFNKARSDQVDTTDLFDRIVSFNLSLTDIALQPDLAALSVTKPLSDAIGHFDGPIQFDSDGWAVDYVVSGYIFDTRVVFDVIKAIADINSTADDDFYNLAKVLLDLIDPQDTDTFDFTKVRSDETIISDDDILEFAKALADVVIQPDGPVQFDSDGWAVDYVVSGYIFDTRVVFDVIKPLTDSVDSLQDNDVIDFTKARADETGSILDDNILDFTKALADAITEPDGPIQFDSDGWAVDYVEPGYIFDTRVVFDVIKPLADIVTVPDDDFYVFDKPLSDITQSDDLYVWDFNKHFTETLVLSDDNDINTNKALFETNSAIDSDFYDLVKPLTETIDPLDVDTINFVKPLTEELIILENKTIAFTRSLTEILIGGDGPVQFDSDGWAVDYVVSGYIFDTRPIFNMIKPFADIVQQPDDADVFNLNKAIADFNDPPLDSNLIDFIKILADDATPLDNIDVFDGSTYSFIKNMPNDSIFVEDQNTNVIEFNRAFTDSINSITEAGLVANQNYIADYFAEDYIGESRLIA